MADPNFHMKLFVGDLAGQVAHLKAQVDQLSAENQRLVGENTILHQQIAQLQARPDAAPDRPPNVRSFPMDPEG